jgi:hypothetical protein
MPQRCHIATFLLTSSLLLTGLHHRGSADEPAQKDAAKPAAKSDAKQTAKPGAKEEKDGWIPLFDGKTLKGWEVTKFGGEGEVSVKDGAIHLEMGNDLTGIHTKRKLPKVDYEVRLEAQRVQGTDFFVGLTFPVNDAPCTLIVGGWGGGVCGLSSIDGFDASENATTSYRPFKNGQWYPVTLRVTADRIQATLDGKEIVDQDIRDHELSIRSEVELSRPFGFASWQTTAALRNIAIRPLPDAGKKK